MPSMSTFLKIARALRVPLSQLQPSSLDSFGELPEDLLIIHEQMRPLSDNNRKLLTDMFKHQAETMVKNMT